MAIRARICIAFVLLVPAAPQPPGTAPEEDVVFRTDTRLVEVPVVVMDRKSRQPVRDLSASDFELKENGVRQDLEFFGLLDIRQTEPRPKTPDSRPEERVFTNRQAPDAEPVPLITILVDAFNASFEEQYYAARAAAEVIEGGGVEARWGLYVLGARGLRILHDYSEDSVRLVERLRRLREAGGTSSLVTDFATAGDPVEGRIGSPNLNIPDLKKRHEFYLRAFTTMWALRGIGAHLSALPGRKTLIWVTAGLSLNAVIGTEPSLWYRTLDALNDANVAVSVVDSAGVRSQRSFLAENPTGRTFPHIHMAGPNANTHVMRGIAESTGGRAFIGTNHLAKAVREAVADGQTVYRLAFRPRHGNWTGQYMKLQVRVKRKGAEVRHRAGYYARPLDPLDLDTRNRVLDDAMTSPLDALEIGLSGRFEEVGEGAVTLVVTADPGSITVEKQGDRYTGQFDIRYAQRTAEGAVVDDFTDEVPLDLTAERAKRASSEGFAYRRRIELKPDAAAIRIALCDPATGRVGSLLATLPVRP